MLNNKRREICARVSQPALAHQEQQQEQDICPEMHVYNYLFNIICI
jgi:hypothetical protein